MQIIGHELFIERVLYNILVVAVRVVGSGHAVEFHLTQVGLELSVEFGSDFGL